jgi:1-acyl-sn-glycerol-3-phosphate acyltransferase
MIELSIKYTMLRKTIIYISELLMTTVVKQWLLVSRRLVSHSSFDEPLHLKKRYVYIANHASYLDPIIMWSVLKIAQRLNGAPTKVMTSAHVYFSLLRPFIWLLGAFPAKNVSGTHSHAGVEGALHYLKKGYNVAIFPEGKRSLQSEGRAFHGVSNILAASDSCEMVLIHIMWHEGSWWHRKLELRACIAPEGLNRHDPKEIMKYIYSL